MTNVKPNLLLVENDPLSVALYNRELSPYYTTISCVNTLQAWAFLERENIAIIILEPADGNGWVWDFFTELKANPKTSHIPVIFCSVLDERKKGFEKGAAAYLVKPVYAHILRQHIQELLGV